MNLELPETGVCSTNLASSCYDSDTPATETKAVHAVAVPF
ncbi:UNVERIFIED_ORG: hypothetical protein ABIC97_002895 [Peribacillus simplex]